MQQERHVEVFWAVDPGRENREREAEGDAERGDGAVALFGGDAAFIHLSSPSGGRRRAHTSYSSIRNDASKLASNSRRSRWALPIIDCFYLVRRAVAAPNPNDLGRMAAREAELVEIGVLGDDHQVVIDE
jgi:hypothetical protein